VLLESGSAVVELGQVAVVLGAEQADILRSVVASHAERMPVMELQSVPFRAAAALRVHESAPPGVALVHGAAYGCR